MYLEKQMNIKKIRITKNQWIVLILVGILLLVIAIPVDSTSEKDVGKIQSEDSQMSAQGEYEQELETRLEDILSDIDGVGAVRVMITLKDTGESVVEKDVSNSYTSSTGDKEEQDTTYESVTVYDGEEEPYEAKEVLPKVEGVLVVAQGGGDSRLKTEISGAVLALFPVEAHKIKVVEMTKQEE